jgi:hypothetical protein
MNVVAPSGVNACEICSKHINVDWGPTRSLAYQTQLNCPRQEVIEYIRAASISAVSKASAELICQFQGHHDSGLLSAAVRTPQAVIKSAAAKAQLVISGYQESCHLSQVVGSSVLSETLLVGDASSVVSCVVGTVVDRPCVSASGLGLSCCTPFARPASGGEFGTGTCGTSSESERSEEWKITMSSSTPEIGSGLLADSSLELAEVGICDIMCHMREMGKERWDSMYFA